MTRMRFSLTPGSLDSVGASLSIACAVHCLALFVVFGMLPLLGLSFVLDAIVERLFFSSSWGPVRVYSFLIIGRYEWVILAVSISLAAASLCWGCRKHGRRRLFLLLGLGLGLIVAGAWADWSGYQTLLLVAGALIVATAQLANRRFCRAAEKGPS